MTLPPTMNQTDRLKQDSPIMTERSIGFNDEIAPHPKGDRPDPGNFADLIHDSLNQPGRYPGDHCLQFAERAAGVSL